MASWSDVDEVAAALPEVERDEASRVWKVRGKAFVFERPLRSADVAELGDTVPEEEEEPLAAWVPDLGEKEVLLAAAPDIYFTTSHFDGYRIVLVHLDRIGRDELEELTLDAWTTRAPKRLARAYLEERGLVEDA